MVAALLCQLRQRVLLSQELSDFHEVFNSVTSSPGGSDFRRLGAPEPCKPLRKHGGVGRTGAEREHERGLQCAGTEERVLVRGRRDADREGPRKAGASPHRGRCCLPTPANASTSCSRLPSRGLRVGLGSQSWCPCMAQRVHACARGTLTRVRPAPRARATVCGSRFGLRSRHTRVSLFASSMMRPRRSWPKQSGLSSASCIQWCARGKCRVGKFFTAARCY